MKPRARVFRGVTLLYVLLASNISQSQWVQTSGPTGSTVTAFAVIGNRIFAGTESGSVFRSTDGGASWSLAAINLTSLGVRSLTASDTMLFAGTGGIGVFRTVDYGIGWTPFNGGLMDMEVNALASNGATLFAGTRTRGVFRWMGSGNWSFVFPASNVRALAAFGNEVFVGAYGLGVFRSVDNGTSWAAVNTGLGALSVQAAATDGSLVLVGTGNGVFRSTNHGANWVSTNLTSSTFALVFADGVLLAGTSAGRIYRSTDAGATWNVVFDIGRQINALAAGGTNVFAGIAENGVFRSSNNGINWHNANNGIANTSIIYMAALDTTVVCISSQSRVFRSSDNGATWFERSSEITPYASGIAALGSSFFIGTSFDLYGGVYRSNNDGQSWISVLSLNAGVYSIGGRDQNVFAGTSGLGGYGLYRSTNGGGAWSLAGSNLSARAFTVFDSILFAGNYRSTDNGITWMTLSLPSQVLAYGIHSSILFAGTENSGALLSTDRGVTWTNVGFQSNSVGGFVSLGRSLFAAALGGVHRTTNNGVSWTPVNEGLSNAFSIAANRTHLFAGTSARGVWRRPLSQIVVDVESENVSRFPSDYSLKQNYPNPFNPTTTIRFHIPEAGKVSLKIYDLLGCEVGTLVNEARNAGSYDEVFGASQLASGVYIYKLTSGNFSASKKLLVVK